LRVFFCGEDVIRLMTALTPRSSSLLLLACAVLSGGVARAETALFSLAIGYNGAPADADPGSVRPLRYADDDAPRSTSWPAG
jgi:hypothetical protein